MKTLLAILFVVFVGRFALADEFVVVNRCGTAPQFTVTNKIIVPALPADESQPAPPGYQWTKRGDGPWMVEKIAPEVAAPKGNTFRDAHDCPACGRRQTTVDRFNAGGTHSHRCPFDGVVWSH